MSEGRIELLGWESYPRHLKLGEIISDRVEALWKSLGFFGEGLYTVWVLQRSIDLFSFSLISEELKERYEAAVNSIVRGRLGLPDGR